MGIGARRGVVAATGAFAVLSAGVVPAFAAAPEVAPHSEGSRFQRDVSAVRQAGAVGVLAETGNGVRARAGVADRRTKRPVSYDTRFRMGSNTKTYVATVMLQLAGEGKLSLDDPVEKWLPGVVRGNGHDGRKMTVRQILQHTSGVHNYTEDIPLFSQEDYLKHRFDRKTPEELVASAMKHKPNFQPGEKNPDGTPKWSYSNTGYVLAGMIIKKATGRTWDQEVRDRIIRPLGLRGTSFPKGATLPRPHARGYQQWEEGQGVSDVTVLNHSWADAAGALVTTTADHNRFFRALLGGRLLPPAMLAEMKRTVPTTWDGPAAGSRYGLGLIWYKLHCGKAGYWGHGGDTLGFKTMEGFTADGRRSVAVTVSTQRVGEAGERLYIAASNLVQNALCEK